ncbi:MAG: hypothetical protein EBR30_10720 [Cytophagia bacterium]|jgi:hypothetical protein|nr:hypothetical protein [Cytophagia bacterium]
MAIKINDKVYVTSAEASRIMNADKSLFSYWLYHGEFSGIIDLNDAEIIRGCDGVEEEMITRLKEAKEKNKKNFFLIPLDEIIHKCRRLERKREIIRSGRKRTNPVEMNNE